MVKSYRQRLWPRSWYIMLKFNDSLWKMYILYLSAYTVGTRNYLPILPLLITDIYVLRWYIYGKPQENNGVWGVLNKAFTKIWTSLVFWGKPNWVWHTSLSENEQSYRTFSYILSRSSSLYIFNRISRFHSDQLTVVQVLA